MARAIRLPCLVIEPSPTLVGPARRRFGGDEAKIRPDRMSVPEALCLVDYRDEGGGDDQSRRQAPSPEARGPGLSLRGQRAASTTTSWVSSVPSMATSGAMRERVLTIPSSTRRYLRGEVLLAGAHVGSSTPAARARPRMALYVLRACLDQSSAHAQAEPEAPCAPRQHVAPRRSGLRRRAAIASQISHRVVLSSVLAHAHLPHSSRVFFFFVVPPTAGACRERTRPHGRPRTRPRLARCQAPVAEASSSKPTSPSPCRRPCHRPPRSKRCGARPNPVLFCA